MIILEKRAIKKVTFSVFFLFLGPNRLLWLYGVANSNFLKKLCILRLHKWSISVSKGAKISEYAIFPHPQNIVIGKGVRIARGATIYQGVTLGAKNGLEEIPKENLYKKYPEICEEAVIYTNSVLVGGIVVGKKAIVGANSFVNSSVDEGCIVVGNPAMNIKKYHDK